MKKIFIGIIAVAAIIGSIVYFLNTDTKAQCKCNDKISCSCSETACECPSCNDTK